MTDKIEEEAKRLIDNHYDSAISVSDLSYSQAKKCSIVTLDEVINTLSDIDPEEIPAKILELQKVRKAIQ